jgi:segregation and condensation protein B
MLKLSQPEDGNKFGLIERQIEAMLFVSPQPVSTQELSAHLGISNERAERALKTIKESYAEGRGLALISVAGGWQMATAPDLCDEVESFASAVSLQKVRLSRAALETLSVIAYNQPVTRSEIEDIRSVRCDRVVDTLLKHGLVRIAGKKKSIGSPLLYRTTDRFLEIFGLPSISALPTLEELKDGSKYGEDAEGAVRDDSEDEQEDGNRDD